MKKTILFYVILFLIIVGISYAASKVVKSFVDYRDAQPCTCPLGMYLSLTDSQKTEFYNLNCSFQQKIAKLKESINYELKALLLETPTDKDQLSQKADEVCILQTELQRQTIDHFIELKRILTPEQQEKFFSLIIERMCPGVCKCPPNKCKCGKD
ncbi:MAG: hypothetical protein V1709_07810 [Planctomycetota bacterium]